MTRGSLICMAIVLVLPLLDLILPDALKIGGSMPPIMIYAIIGLGLNIVTGFTGLLNLGSAAFMAIGAYAFAILTCDVHPFQLGFWCGLAGATAVGALAGLVLGLPTLRLRGDYLAIVTLGFGEIVQDVLKNLDAITKGTQGLNPVASPRLGLDFSASYVPWYYLLLALLGAVALLCHNLRYARIGRTWVAVREDELAARACGIPVVRAKLLAFSLGAALCAAGGALWASLNGSSIEPGYYDFQKSVVVLCIVIVGGLGSIPGVLLGALIMAGFNSIVLNKLTDLLGASSSANVLAVPANWKYLIFGLALILMMRYRPEGLLPAREVRAELHRGDGDAPEAA